jgi:hypothetical protein
MPPRLASLLEITEKIVEINMLEMEISGIWLFAPETKAEHLKRTNRRPSIGFQAKGGNRFFS